MAITYRSAITYRRGIPNNYTNFYLVSQAINVTPTPMGLYLRGFQFYNRNVTNSSLIDDRGNLNCAMNIYY
jgi:hypothetical protein